MPFGSPFGYEGHQSLILRGVMRVFKVTGHKEKTCLGDATHGASLRPTSTTGKQRELAEVTMACGLMLNVMLS